MENILELTRSNLTSPVVLFFGLGILFTLMKAKVHFPSAISDGITIYLLIAIGFKGGVAVSEAGISLKMFSAIAGALALGVIIPLYSFYILKSWLRFTSDDAAALAGHYGSISVVTFIAATTFLNSSRIPYEAYINGIPALMEVPAIIIALILASRARQGSSGFSDSEPDSSLPTVAKQVLLSKSVVLLLGGMLAGFISGPKGMESVQFFYQDLFMGVLSLFMLEMGMIAALKLGDLKENAGPLLLFGIATPVLNAILGILTGHLAGLSIGGTTLLAVLAASSSYIVAPAAMRVSLPKANPAIYLGASLGVTLPFNLIVGIPLYYSLAVFLKGLL